MAILEDKGQKNIGISQKLCERIGRDHEEEVEGHKAKLPTLGRGMLCLS